MRARAASTRPGDGPVFDAWGTSVDPIQAVAAPSEAEAVGGSSACAVLRAGVGSVDGGSLRLESLYRIRFTYPESWIVELDGGWQQHLFLAEGRCEGTVSVAFVARTLRSGRVRLA